YRASTVRPTVCLLCWGVRCQALQTSLLGRSMSSTSDFLPSIGVFGCRSQGSRFSSGSALLGPPMMESEGCGGPIWSSVLALRHGAAQGIQRTRLIHRPCGDIAPPLGGILPSPVL